MKRWYSMRDTNSSEVELLLYDTIGNYWEESVTAKQFVDDLKGVAGKNLHVRINSPGGDVFDGVAIYNALISHSGRVRTTVDGIAASMASVIAMAGEPLTMPENAMLMIHNPWTLAMGDSGELRKTADVLDRSKLGLVAAYQRKSGLSSTELSRLMDEETWLTGKEAVERGFADQSTAPIALAAKTRGFDFGGYRHTPAALRYPGQTRTPSEASRRVAVARRRMQLMLPDAPPGDSHSLDDYRWDS